MKEKIPVECENCEEIVIYKQKDRRQYTNPSEGMCQIGMSKKYKGDFASYCKNHNPTTGE